MLSRLIVTFLCAATIGSVSGAFMTFDPEQIVFEDIEKPISFSARLNTKPTEKVTVYFENPLMSMSTCMIVFNPGNWDVPQEITAVRAPLFVGSSDPPGRIKVDPSLLAKAVTVGSLPTELSTTDVLEFRKLIASLRRCSIINDKASTFDRIPFSFNKPGWYKMMSTRDIEVQVFMDKCTAGLPCITKVLARYGSSVMGMDVSGSIKNIDEYSVTQVTQSTNGMRYTPGTEAGEHKIDFPYGSVLNVKISKQDGGVSLRVEMVLLSGYPSPRGLCNRPRSRSPNNRLIGSDDKSYSRDNEDEINVFANSWGVKSEDVLTNPGARTLNLPTQPGTMCKFPVNPQPDPVIPVPATTTTTTTTTTTVDLSKSTSAPAITYVLSSTTITTSPSTTSTTLPYPPPAPPPGEYVHPPPPAPGGYLHPPPSPKPDVVDKIQRCPKPARI